MSGGCVLDINKCQTFNIDNLVVDFKQLVDLDALSQQSIANFLMKNVDNKQDDIV